VDRTMMVRADQYHVGDGIQAAPTQPSDVMCLA
jgi:hypothetical protein